MGGRAPVNKLVATFHHLPPLAKVAVIGGPPAAALGLYLASHSSKPKTPSSGGVPARSSAGTINETTKTKIVKVFKGSKPTAPPTRIYHPTRKPPTGSGRWKKYQQLTGLIEKTEQAMSSERKWLAKYRKSGNRARVRQISTRLNEQQASLNRYKKLRKAAWNKAHNAK
jgi:hypothetical protein